MIKAIPGAYPTMITPYNSDKTVDYGAVRALTAWYYERGCAGVFASCQSSEIWYLGLEDRVKLAQTVKDESDRLAAEYGRKLMVVASGHVSYDREEQVRELNLMAETGVDAVILISNRLNIENTGDDDWISDLSRLLPRLPDETALGVYECPHPYKRLMNDKLLSFCALTGRFAFMKDTCCDADLIAHRCEKLFGTGMSLFNANGQTLLTSLRDGAAGYCGVMCNFYPGLISWLCRNFDTQPMTAERVAAFLCLASFTEGLTYPASAKYYLAKYQGFDMSTFSRSTDDRKLNRYARDCIDMMTISANELSDELGL
ncbi:MAG TPA: dihydrodipicolinate synthase family protein [Clostridiales bacterium]|nr:dihydrodipicolinate synthase family protein [Clostridiales bacterium]